MVKDIKTEGKEQNMAGQLETSMDVDIPKGGNEKLIEKEIQLFKKFFAEKQINQLYKRYGLSLLYSLSGEDMIMYEKELEIKPQTAVDFYNHGVYYAANKNSISQAVKCFQKAVELDSNFSSAHYNLALAYQASKEDRLAKKEFAEFIRLEEEKLEDSKKIKMKEGEINYPEEAMKILNKGS